MARRIALLINARARVKLLFRLRQECIARGWSFGLKLVTFRLARWGVYVHPTAEIRGELMMGHPTGIVIGRGVVIEEGVGIWQNVTIGAKSAAVMSEHDYPTIRRGARLYAGAVVVGGVEIGPGAVVGANAVVLESVEPGSVVVGSPARVVQTGDPR